MSLRDGTVCGFILPFVSINDEFCQMFYLSIINWDQDNVFVLTNVGFVCLITAKDQFTVEQHLTVAALRNSSPVSDL